MASYLGNTPALSYISFAVQHFTVTATTSYTLDYSVTNELDIRLVINNVVQQPGSSYAYTASGTSLSLSEATSVGDTMYAVFLGKAVQTVTPASGSVTNAMLGETITVANGGTGLTSGFKNGVTELDQWRLNSDTNTGSNADVTSNWERVDSSGWGKIGTGLTESSGIFSFSQTGIFRIDFRATFQGSTNDTVHRFDLSITLDNSSYNAVAQARGGNLDSDITGQSSGSNVFFFDVTDTSLCKFKFVTASFDGSTFLKGSTTFTQTGFEIMRIGDT